MTAKKGFTLSEILIVVIILGIMASFAIPGYLKTITRGHIKGATVNLISIHAANTIHRSESGKYWPEAVGPFGLDDINLNLRLSIISSPAVAYSCSGQADGSTFSCTATGDNFVVTIDQDPIDATNPSCSPAGVCP